MFKHTPGPWRIESDAQGPCMVMHPTLHGVAIATLTDVFKPFEGIYDPLVDEPLFCAEAMYETTYHPERVANVRLCSAAPELFDVAHYAANMPDSDEMPEWAKELRHRARAAIAKATGETVPA